MNIINKTGCVLDSLSIENNSRGGVYISDSSNVVLNTIKFNNNGVNDPYFSGGALYIASSHNIIVKNTHFNNNNANYGGGVHIRDNNMVVEYILKWVTIILNSITILQIIEVVEYMQLIVTLQS
eukprot:93366_1